MHNQSAATCSRWFLDRDFFYPGDGGDNFIQDLHGATSLKTIFFIGAAVKTSNSTYKISDWAHFRPDVSENKQIICLQS
jgi:hypothetical protein